MLVRKRLEIFRYEMEEARNTLNMLIAVNYLLKHGATAFVDELRDFAHFFTTYQTMKNQNKIVYQD